MSNLAVLSLKNRALIALITIVAAVFGGLALTSLKQELIPSIEFPALVVVSTYPGASPEVVNNDVSTPIENAIQGVPGLESIDGDQHDERVDRAGVVHLRHRPRDRRAEDDAGDQPHLEPAAGRRRAERHLGEHRRLPRHPGRRHRLRRRRDDPGAARGERRPRARGRRRASTPRRSSAASASASRSRPTRRSSPRPATRSRRSATRSTRTACCSPAATSPRTTRPSPCRPARRSRRSTRSRRCRSCRRRPSSSQAGAVTIADVATVEQNQDPVTTISRVDGEPAITIAVTKLPSANTVDVSKGVLAVLPDLEDDLERRHVHRRVRPGALHPAVDREPRASRACSASSSPCSSSWCSCCRCARPS